MVELARTAVVQSVSERSVTIMYNFAQKITNVVFAAMNAVSHRGASCHKKPNAVILEEA